MKFESPAADIADTARKKDRADQEPALAQIEAASAAASCAPGLAPFRKLAAAAQQIFSFRQKRRQYLDETLVGEGGWDSLLRLYIAWAAGERITVGTLARDIGLPATTVLRWVDRLVEQRLVTKQPNPLDRRATFLELTPMAIARMTGLLQEHQRSSTDD